MNGVLTGISSYGFKFVDRNFKFNFTQHFKKLVYIHTYVLYIIYVYIQYRFVQKRYIQLGHNLYDGLFAFIFVIYVYSSNVQHHFTSLIVPFLRSICIHMLYILYMFIIKIGLHKNGIFNILKICIYVQRLVCITQLYLANSLHNLPKVQNSSFPLVVFPSFIFMQNRKLLCRDAHFKKVCLYNEYINCSIVQVWILERLSLLVSCSKVPPLFFYFSYGVGYLQCMRCGFFIYILSYNCLFL
eukprot:TRINITY_DN4367_c1_g2_i6.p3 TRINITY_DN4367_c1_g2~~TRINITY_DN4367_c1_g2_i6.p3  ORF type:complete len:242 (-),score=-16.74 TRINITY_DN4367_c1_g2_i6:266-991(-)